MLAEELVVAKADIEPDTVLFTIPRSAVLCWATSELSSLIPAVVQSNGADDEHGSESGEEGGRTSQDPWTSLILIMIFEFLRGDKSPWKSYLDVLPATFDTPMFWTENELRELQASPVVERIGKVEADEMITKKVLPVIRAHSGVFFPKGSQEISDEDLFGLAHRMGSTILAYSFSLENDDSDDEEKGDGCKDGSGCACHGGDKMVLEDENGDADADAIESEDDDGWVEDREDQLPLGMVPMADMLNADAEFNAHINHGTDVLTATSVRHIKAGEEILNFYGPLSNGELMRRYGYTTEKHEHFDAIDIPWKLVLDAIVSKIGMSQAGVDKTLESFDPDDLEDPLMIDREFDEDEEAGRLATLKSGKILSKLPPVLRRQARAFTKRALREQKKERQKNNQVRDAREGQNDENGIAMAAVTDAITARLSAYPTTLEADLALLRSLEENGPTPTSSRLRMALRVRIGEKRLLNEAAVLAHEAIQAGSNKAKKGHEGSGLDEQRGAKRQRTRY
ncbi:set domain containing protein [Grosmannia clavigera kw1407]|uniref:Ribosomal lysine N-methyltransferase 4 n=1 Tax=Grosmannia clavigera (strain kw1407 / UAMH 11150) TaxID=655863 RepID=F0XNV3_GROCL|nr:set domain containing protein [Grosmannia clavigera kw1407]EFX00522.1 set domain containing protein [Grosmannia clavigera kw1407]